MKEVLQKAIDVAVDAHRGQKRWDGSPYILHPMAVMLSLESDVDRVVGILHDVMEDTDVTSDTIRERVIDNDIIIGALALLVHSNDEAYEDYIDAIVDGVAGQYQAARIAARVKLADLRDNMYVFGMDYSGARVHTKKLVQYHAAMRKLKAALRSA